MKLLYENRAGHPLVLPAYHPKTPNRISLVCIKPYARFVSDERLLARIVNNPPFVFLRPLEDRDAPG